jgi:hypothetical protein
MCISLLGLIIVSHLVSTYVGTLLVALAALGTTWVDPVAPAPPFASSSSVSAATRDMGSGRRNPAPRATALCQPTAAADVPWQHHDDDDPLLFVSCGCSHPSSPVAWDPPRRPPFATTVPTRRRPSSPSLTRRRSFSAPRPLPLLRWRSCCSPSLAAPSATLSLFVPLRPGP